MTIVPYPLGLSIDHGPEDADRPARPRHPGARLCRRLRRAELAALNVEDLVEVADGFRVLIRRSKTDQERQGQEIAIPHGRHLKPVATVKAWLAASGITSGPLFRPISRSGRIRGEARLTDRSIAEVVKRYAARSG